MQEAGPLMRKGSGAVLSPQANLCSLIQKYNSEKNDRLGWISGLTALGVCAYVCATFSLISH